MRSTKSCLKTIWSSDYKPCKKQVHFTEDTVDPYPSATSHTLVNWVFVQPEDMDGFDRFSYEPVGPAIIRRTRSVSTPTSSPIQPEQISTCAPLKSCLKKPRSIELHAQLPKTVHFNEKLEYDTNAVKHAPPQQQHHSPPQDSSSRESKTRTEVSDRSLKRANVEKQGSLAAKKVRFAVDDDRSLKRANLEKKESSVAKRVRFAVDDNSGSDTEEFSDIEEHIFRIKDLVTDFRVETAYKRMKEQELLEWDNYMYRKSLMENKIRNTKTSTIKKRRPSLPQQRSDGVERGVKSGLAGSVPPLSTGRQVDLKTAKARHPRFRV
ncbi:hypothetical protein CKAH01_16017 [Colletotrichum kahawae]|uniref:Uncharacterized protein n=1 Tax=Colletotrichum kahawae TaxID=34407 RepID=A0AAD9YGR2_COLKA|nr:hypothetical protein CKAH01_16017 [Colletotrichum kahawae]